MRKILIFSLLMLTACIESPKEYDWLSHTELEMKEKGWTFIESTKILLLNEVPIFDFDGDVCPGRYRSHPCTKYLGPPYLWEELTDKFYKDKESSIKERMQKDADLLGIKLEGTEE